ncbi:MAG: hypothetical protein ABFD79_07940 [Phycisphaerales bacterium]
MNLIIKHIPSLFWTILEQASGAGISRLVLFPIVAHMIGKDDFGLFATLISFALMIGNQPANGLAIGLLRNLSHYQGRQQDQLVSTAVRMCHRFLLYFLSAVMVVLIALFVFETIDRKSFLCLTFLMISLYAENRFMLMLTPLRYKRQFRESSFWFLVASLCILIFGVIGCYFGGIVGLSFGMMLANFVIYLIAANKYFEADLKYNPEQAGTLRWVWIHMTIAGILILAGPHLNRIVLRYFADNESVADLFAATGIMYTLIMPISNCSKLLLGMVSKYKTINEISFYVYKMLLGMMIAGAVLGMILFSLVAPIMLKFLFPGFGDRASGLFRILVWMIPSNIVIAFIRPLITKFANVVYIPRINFAVLSVTLILMFSLIPIWQLEGAAWSIAISNIFAASLNILIFCVVYRQSLKSAVNRITTKCSVIQNNNEKEEMEIS